MKHSQQLSSTHARATFMRRRDMIKLTTLAMAAPLFIPARLLGEQAPSNTLQIGCIGTGRMGRGDMMGCLRSGLDERVKARIIAVCDVNAERAALARAEVEKAYADKLPAGAHPKVAVYTDYRELLARKDIDGVTISTPDHWHALNARDAANAGKDIYVQKPLTWALAEGQALVKAVRRNQVILQTGSQQRSETRFRRACELVRNGRLGKLQSIHVALPADSGTGKATPMPVPANLNYDLWLGPVAESPYTEDRVHPQQGFGRPGFLQIERHCLGMITGWGSHMFDIAQWGKGADATGPVEMQARGEFPDRGLFNVHTRFEAEGAYADGVKLTASTGSPAGVKFTGAEGWLFVQRGGWEASDEKILEEKIGENETRLYVSNDHIRNFLECMRTRREPVCPVETGHRSNTICVITHIAMKLGRKLRWDPQAERFLHDDSANAMLSVAYRKPWAI